ncbi:MAG: DUF222 domain-containing protein [Actinomycetota bacterium]
MGTEVGDMGREEEASRDGVPLIIPRLADPAGASVEERDEHLALLEAARQALEVEWTETLAAAVDAGDSDFMGYPTTVAYLKHRMGMAAGRANRYVKNARMASRHAATFSSWKHRLITGDEADLLFRTAERYPDEYQEAEHGLLELVGDGIEETRRLVDYWTSHVESPRRRLEQEEQMERRHCRVTRRTNGMVSGEFALPTLEGESLLSALDVLMPAPADGDSRTAVQRRADALGDLARAFLDGSESPTVAGERPHLNVHVELPALQGAAGLNETEDGVALDPFLTDQISCDASVCRIVFGPRSEILDVGRKTRVVPAATRRAVAARDRNCVATGCDRPARWCDVHHVEHWLVGGETEPGNLVLLCRYHHSRVHLDLLTVEAPGSTPLQEVGGARST